MSGNKIIATILSSIVFIFCFVGFGLELHSYSRRIGFKADKGLIYGFIFGGLIWVIYLIIELLKKRKEKRTGK